MSQFSTPCVFLDRDGVLNKDDVNYTWELDKFEILDGVKEALQQLKAAGFKLVVITNQSGIDKGIYGHEDVAKCHAYLQEQTGHCIDKFYYSPYHRSKTESLARKPGTLFFEKAISRFGIDVKRSFMVGDMERDLIPAKQMGLKTFLIKARTQESSYADDIVDSLLSASKKILNT